MIADALRCSRDGPRDPEQIQREIESTRTQLAGTLDELAERVSPKRLAGRRPGTAPSSSSGPRSGWRWSAAWRCWSRSASPAGPATAEPATDAAGAAAAAAAAPPATLPTGRPKPAAAPVAGQPGSCSTAAGSVLPPQTTAATRSPGSGR